MTCSSFPNRIYDCVRKCYDKEIKLLIFRSATMVNSAMSNHDKYHKLANVIKNKFRFVVLIAKKSFKP